MAKSSALKAPKKKEDPRIEIRTDLKIKATIQKAAEMVGSSVSSFMISNALEAANRVFAEQNQLVLNDEARDLFLAMVQNPPEPNAALRKAADRFKKMRS